MKGLLFFLVIASGFSICSAKNAKKDLPAPMTEQEYRSYVTEQVSKKSKDLAACKKQTNPKKGRLLIAWEIDEKGKSRDFTKGTDTVENEKLYHCMIKKMEKWKFTAPPEDRSISAEYEFTF